MADDSDIAILIELYQSQENLYNTETKAYHDRDKARESLMYIARCMRKDWSLETTKGKLKWLRDSYTKNLRALLQKTKSGASTDDVKIKWKWFSVLDAFLRPYCKVTTPVTSNLLVERSPSQTVNEDFMDSQPMLSASQASNLEPLFNVNPTDSGEDSPVDPSRARRSSGNTLSPAATYVSNIPAPDFTKNDRKRKAEPSKSKSTVILEDMASQLKQRSEERETENYTVGKYIASQLEKLKPRDQIKTRKKIYDVVYEATLEATENDVAHSE